MKYEPGNYEGGGVWIPDTGSRTPDTGIIQGTTLDTSFLAMTLLGKLIG
jgi:hypothetical protein